jgi:hypothetical protein
LHHLPTNNHRQKRHHCCCILRTKIRQRKSTKISSENHRQSARR